ncbi:aldehyde dehydrogenase family protein, partial [Asanoa sp. NPDC050611]|uniref:aldehyde dehydrogenase family protein n=1 Tax=Asanoa sp. NPDC050611 TaxID=3157098 RepID=UPI0033EF8123
MDQTEAGRAAAKVADRDRLYIDGEWVSPLDALPMPVQDPSTEEVVAQVPAAGSADVDRAVAAARAAFDPWAGLSPDARADHLDRLLGTLSARAEQIAATIAIEVGTPIKVAHRVQTGLPLTVLAGYAARARDGFEPETIRNSLVVREPAGVVGAITPWNYPLHQVIGKVGAALAAGCTVVLKPAELTPLTAYLLFDAIDEAGLPHGVVNLVTGSGPVAGSALAAHPDVDVVSFTGSTATGAAISRLAADRNARDTLEL